MTPSSATASRSSWKPRELQADQDAVPGSRTRTPTARALRALDQGGVPRIGVILFGEGHLRRAIDEYLMHYNRRAQPPGHRERADRRKSSYRGWRDRVQGSPRRAAQVLQTRGLTSGRAADALLRWGSSTRRTRLARARPDFRRFARLKLSVEAELDVGRVVAHYGLFELQPNGASQAVKRLADRAEVRLHFHQLRHLYATELLRRGVSIRVVQELLGHHSVKEAQRYCAVTDVDRKEAAHLLG